jgi:pimeloyl-ACP methyl ester carboxylesterase
MTRELSLPDGRVLIVHEEGPDDGAVIVVHTGTPVAGPPDAKTVADAAARGARIVGLDRPGYAGSTRRPGRSIAGVAEDVTAILDDLGVERCVTWGISGGGPHALACAALLPDRIAAAASLAAVAPYGADGVDFLAGMGQDNLDEFGAAVEGEEPLRAYLEGEAAGLADITGDAIGAGLESLLPEVDLAVLTGDYADHLAAGLRTAVSQGVDGWLDDDLAFVKPWGFDLAEIRIPVLLYQGDHDLMVPPTHGAWLAQHIPGVDARLTADDGHLTLDARRVPEVHEWLLARL